MSNEKWREVVVRVRNEEGGTWREAGKAIAEYFPDLDIDRLMRKARASMEKFNRAERRKNTEEVESKHKVTYKDNGEMVFEGLIALLSGQEITPEIVMKGHNLKPDEWTVISFTSNAWQSQVKGGEKIVLWQSKITVRPRTTKEITFEDVDRYFENKDFSAPLPFVKCDYDESGEILEVCIPDLHSGLLAWKNETGEDYNLNIAKERFFTAISDIVNRCGIHSISKILFVTLGDLLHTDNDAQTTTKGTFQQVDGRIAQIFDHTLDMIIDGIRMLSEVAPVEVIYLCGNHDRVLGYTLAKATEKAFAGSNGVDFDVSPNPQKHRLLGVSLVGWTHGDMPKKNMAGWLQDRARKEFGLCKYAEIHSGHYHSEQVQTTTGGVIVRYMPNIASASSWEHQQGFPHGVKTIVCYRWNAQAGLRSIWYNNI
jgi:hypothetical protein